jgi:hypothetical protein
VCNKERKRRGVMGERRDKLKERERESKFINK